ncbi:uncharacterized protein LOC121694386 [Alosa sapidissima]|uniref:uncharacterized protein LOC121694386 n=1 Tax=Alosa sapidissima TaxID=34773 RepID=UPI001C08C417|nr:uncharacterized protein LOC121694386 [Alosa sapidissima]
MNWLHCSSIAFLCAVSLVCQRVSSIDMELHVRPGDDIILYCDRVKKTGSDIVWFRGFSADAQTCTNISVMEAYRNQVYNLSATSHLTPVWNAVNQSYDLEINGVRELDRGLYYCASEDKVRPLQSETVAWRKVYNFSKDAIWVSVTGSCVTLDAVPTTCSPFPWECGQCWVVLVSLCLACVLLSAVISSACVYCLCSKTDKGITESGLPQNRTDMQVNRNRRQIEDGDLCYASLNLPIVKNKQRQNKRTHNSDFTYSQAADQSLKRFA